MGSRSIYAKIWEIHEQKINGHKRRHDVNDFHGYDLGIDFNSRLVYLCTIVHEKILDQSKEPTSNAIYMFKVRSRPGDQLMYVAPKKLAGVGEIFNTIPVNSNLDISQWKTDEDATYNYIKQGKNRFARLEYAFEYDDESQSEFSRPQKILYHFKLFDGKKVKPVQKLAGEVKNPSQ